MLKTAKIFLLTLLTCFAFASSHAQSKKVVAHKKVVSIPQRHVYESVEEMPMPEGGVEKIVGTIARNLHYPDSCELPGGRIIIAFVVEADGTIDNETVVRDPCGNDHLLSNRLFDIVKKTKWTPGKMNGKPVATRYSLPLTICLGSDD
jgi:hypothetical protein